MDTQRKVKFRDIVEINPRESIPKSTPAKYVAMENLLPFTKKISKYEIKKYKGGAKFRNGDTLLARITPCLENGKTAFVDILKENEIGFGSTEYIVIRKKTKITDSHYVYYLSTSPRFRDSAIKLMSGTSGRQRIEIEGLKNLNISLPPLSEQKRIANILSSFDNKIEILKKENKILEDIAENIFKEWFVKYNFPNKDGKPYKDSGGKMIDSELGPIPKGWRVGKLGDYINIKGGGTPSTKEPSYWNGRLHWTTPKDLSNLEGLFIFKSQNKITKLGLSKISSGLLPKRTLLLSSRAPIGYLALTGIETAINQGFIAFLPNSYTPNTYMYLWLKQNIKLIESIANGSTFLEINKENLRNFVVIIPPKELLDKFDLNITTFFERISMSENVIEKLRRTKTALLYKLIK